MFTDLVDMLDHKRDYCKLRFTCKCDLLNEEECDCDASTPELFAASSSSTSSSLLSSSSTTSSSDVATANTSSSSNTNHSNSTSGSSATADDPDNKDPSKGTPGHGVRPPGKPQPKKRWLHCVSCKSPFASAWDLMVHVQAAHMMNIYQLADTQKLQQQMAAAAAAASDNSKSDHSNPTNQPFNQPPPQSDNPVASTAGSCHNHDSEHPGEGKLIDHGLGNVQHLSGQGSVHH